MSRTVKFRKFKMLFFFQNERRYKAGNFYKDLLFGHLQPGVHKNSEGLAILILEFDDVMVKTLYERGFLRLHLCDTRLPRFEELAYASL